MSAQVSELPRWRSAFESLEPGDFMFLRWPNGNGVGAAAFHPDTARRLVDRGYLILDGIRVNVRYESPDWYDSPINGPQPPCPYSLLLEFEEHWEVEHP